MKLGDAIKQAREAKKLTLEDLAEKVGISAEFLQQIESGDVSPVPELNASICVHLDIAVPVISFMALEEDDVPEAKRAAFRELQGPIRELIDDIFLVG